MTQQPNGELPSAVTGRAFEVTRSVIHLNNEIVNKEPYTLYGSFSIAKLQVRLAMEI
ncbi:MULTISPECIES: hypothetical protein [Pseudoalteromonas]|uniref:Uncharacterized protein n=1 Tax=Pseudoalteromonas undina TaxID=43660 RepID=A0ACC6R3W7_9GAMM|nr:hypothetical protein [Pseudoalteromonas sp. P1-13-1a]